MEEWSERPIAYASRTLSPTELKYAQLDKEAFSIVFGVKHFHQFLYGRKFTILSDHKPLQYLLGDSWGANHGCSHSMLGIDVKCLQLYTRYAIYKPGADHANADGLSQLPVSNPVTTVLLTSLDHPADVADLPPPALRRSVRFRHPPERFM